MSSVDLPKEAAADARGINMKMEDLEINLDIAWDASGFDMSAVELPGLTDNWTFVNAEAGGQFGAMDVLPMEEDLFSMDSSNMLQDDDAVFAMPVARDSLLPEVARDGDGARLSLALDDHQFGLERLGAGAGATPSILGRTGMSLEMGGAAGPSSARAPRASLQAGELDNIPDFGDALDAFDMPPADMEFDLPGADTMAAPNGAELITAADLAPADAPAPRAAPARKRRGAAMDARTELSSDAIRASLNNPAATMRAVGTAAERAEAIAAAAGFRAPHMLRKADALGQAFSALRFGGASELHAIGAAMCQDMLPFMRNPDAPQLAMPESSLPAHTPAGLAGAGAFDLGADLDFGNMDFGDIPDFGVDGPGAAMGAELQSPAPLSVADAGIPSANHALGGIDSASVRSGTSKSSQRSDKSQAVHGHKVHKRTRRMVAALAGAMGPQRTPVQLQELATGVSRRTAATAFLELLVLKTREAVQVEQPAPLAPIQVSAGKYFEDYVQLAA